ncbi:aspartate/glutamate racemase family protein [Knoellia subterranea]|uniref:Arylsulfatase n=1 Tax=Knoellia subterranea KCTC 19937 TaxID=1385521 RepID=A0A0A0JN92_9MICO|nr:aspartate/glutamate racemase family protein [Knoellia subterranea]KGN38239.1 hypothetical protein N803_10820 [Knoellia subterranea KCTC 19937]
MGTIGYLHTSPVHVPTFDRLTQEHSAEAKTLHVVDEDALTLARAASPSAVAEVVAAHVRDLRERGADVIVCTCSTIGAIAEGLRAEPKVLRVDRPMARRAVALGARVGVVVALESTVQPTVDLLREEAAVAGREIEVLVELAEDAWDLFEKGDHAAYLTVVAETARDVAARADVVVLAQASMLGALDLLRDLAVPALASPTTAVDHAAAMVDAST